MPPVEHTSFPWYVSRGTREGEIVLAETLFWYVVIRGERDLTPEEDEANARLMAAAPELLAVAHAAMQLLRQMQMHTEFPAHPVWKNWKIVLAKATRHGGRTDGQAEGADA